MMSDAPPGLGQRIGALAIVLLAVAAAAAVIPYGNVQLPVIGGFMPAFGSVVCFADLATAALLLGQARAVNSRPAARLSAAYFFSFLIVIPHLLAFPGAFVDGMILGGVGTATWLWCAWHGGFAVFVAAFALSGPENGTLSRRDLSLAVVVLAAAATAAVMTTLGLQFLPTIQVGQNYSRLNTLGIGPAVIVCNLAALALVVIRLRARSAVALWLIVAMSAATLDVALVLTGSGRFTLSWYTGRVLSVLSNVSVFIAMLFESMRLFGQVSRMNLRLEHLSVTDQLTQLPNRRAFEPAFDNEWRRAKREALPISMVMVDVDQFKSFNDRLGHPAGDRCLQLVADTARRVIRRPLDMAARLGGEEFALLLPNTDAPGAAHIGEMLRAAIEALQVANPGAGRGIVTVSIGIATEYPHQTDIEPATLIDRADGALYAAKRMGRNRVEIAGSRVDGAADMAAMAPEADRRLPGSFGRRASDRAPALQALQAAEIH